MTIPNPYTGEPEDVVTLPERVADWQAHQMALIQAAVETCPVCVWCNRPIGPLDGEHAVPGGVMHAATCAAEFDAMLEAETRRDAWDDRDWQTAA